MTAGMPGVIAAVAMICLANLVERELVGGGDHDTLRGLQLAVAEQGSRFDHPREVKRGSANAHDLNVDAELLILFGKPRRAADSLIPTPGSAQNEGRLRHRPFAVIRYRQPGRVCSRTDPCKIGTCRGRRILPPRP